MYRGLAQLVGMTKIPTPDGPEAEFQTWAEVRADYDFAFIHIKATDMYGEDGDFEAKTAAIEKVDRALPSLLETKPGVLAVTGDHSTPVPYKAHGWQPVPVMVHAERAGADGLARFSERNAVHGTLGTIQSCQLIPVLLACADRLAKFGA
jgi:2,3-bisphosphoglycerate-independent phosphoglycerate mutase